MMMSPEHGTVAEAYLEMLATRGVRYFFGNSGTDFAPIIEAFAKRKAQGAEEPRPVTVPHEITAVAMAHGYTMVTGRPQVVMVHVIVGAANALGGIINAARAQVPMLFTAGRTPLTEKGHAGSRDLGIHWAQESFDQGAMVREFVKWDYELRLGSQLETVVDRALAIAQSTPCGPVYITLPREVLCETREHFDASQASRISSAPAFVPEPAALEKAARSLAAARNPIVVAQSAGRDPDAVSALTSLAETLALPVVEQWHTHTNFPQDHPLHAGYDLSPYLQEADLVVAVEADTPWFPKLAEPAPGAKILQVAADPLFSRYPIRGFPVDVALAGSPRPTLAALEEAVRSVGVDASAVEARRERWNRRNAELRSQWQARAEEGRSRRPIDPAWASKCVGEILDDRTTVVNEYVLDPTQACFHNPGRYFRYSPSAALGWGLGAALGAKLARPDHKVICCLGDGAYMFGVPVSAHFVSRAYDLPVVFVVFNNGCWNASRRSTLALARDGWAARADALPLCELEPAVDYDRVCEAAGGYGERVEDPEELPGAIQRALRVIENERRQALLNVICGRQ
jgi:acetolactate synthase-1/2/3 large subunit